MSYGAVITVGARTGAPAFDASLKLGEVSSGLPVLSEADDA